MNSTNKIILSIVIVIGYLIVLTALVNARVNSGNASYIALAAFLFLIILFLLKQVWNKNESTNNTINKNNLVNEVNVCNNKNDNYSSIEKLKNKIKLLEAGKETDLITEEEYDNKLKEFNYEINRLEKQELRKQNLENETLIFEEKKVKLLNLVEAGVIDFNEYSSKLNKLKNEFENRHS